MPGAARRNAARSSRPCRRAIASWPKRASSNSSTIISSAIFSRFRRRRARSCCGRLSTRPSSIARRWPTRCAFRPPNSPSWRSRFHPPPIEALSREQAIFDGLAGLVLARRSRLKAAAEALADDRRRRGARRARRQAPTGRGRRSTIRSPSRIEAGRHPVVEAALRRGGEAFVANDCALSGDAGEGGLIAVVTGPNMAGKSTYLRQNALIAMLAQMGSFVPAARRRSASSTGCSRASARPTISRAAARPSWSRWSRRRRSSIRRASARSSSSTRSAAAPRPSTASPSPGR